MTWSVDDSKQEILSSNRGIPASMRFLGRKAHYLNRRGSKPHLEVLFSRLKGIG